jgi:putative glutamine amidotransferase
MPVHIAIPEPTSPQYVDDSIPYNQRSLPQYLHALISAGATPIVIPLHESPQRVAKILSTCHGICLPGSPADIDPQKYGAVPNALSAPPDPARAAVDELLIQDAFNLHKPILAICQGHQALNVWLGGTLIQDIPTEVTASDPPTNHAPDRSVHEAHPIVVTEGTRLAGLVPALKIDHDPALTSQILVNSSHHQAVQTPGDGLLVSAISPNDGVIEAVELANSSESGHFVLSFQWHPERTYDTNALSRAIFHSFVEAAEHWIPRKIEESVLQA